MTAAQRRKERLPFVQIVTSVLDALTDRYGWTFEERAFVEDLVLLANHETGAIAWASQSALADELGYGPSGRRTIAKRLDRLEAAGLVSMERRGGHGTPVDVGALRARVCPGSADRAGRRFVQLIPQALDELCEGEVLSADARCALRRLVLEAGHDTRAVKRARLARRWRIGPPRLDRILNELVDVGAVSLCGADVIVEVYTDVVRAPLVACPADPPGATDRAGQRASDRANRRANEPTERANDQAQQALDVDVQTGRPDPSSSDLRARTACAELGRLDAQQAEARGTPIVSRPAYERECARRRWQVHGDQLLELADAHPGWTPEVLADQVDEGPPALGRARVLPFPTGVAAQVLAADPTWQSIDQVCGEQRPARR